MAIIKGGSSTAGNTNVNANFELEVHTNADPVEVGFTALAAEPDPGDITGARTIRPLDITTDYRLRTGVDSVVFSEQFPGAALNTSIWTSPVTTGTITVAGGFCTLNAGSSTASGAVERITSYRSFPIYMTYPTYTELDLQLPQLPQANNVCEWGLGIATGVAAPTDGAFFRLNATGEFRCVVNNNGTETQSSALDFTALVGQNKTRHFLVSLSDDQADFWIDDVLVASITKPQGSGAITASPNLPILIRNYNTGIVAVAQQIKVGAVNVTLGDMNQSKPWAHVMCGAGAAAYQGQTSGTMGSTALMTNNLAVGAGAAMTNTTAALGSGLGGQFTALPTLAAATDGIVCSYQVPVGTSAVPGKSLYITGVRIQSVVSAALTGGPVVYVYSLAYGHNAVSLATTVSATAKAPVRIPLGIETIPAASAVGFIGSTDAIDKFFDSPVVVYPGEFVQVVAKNIGTVTTVGTVTFIISFDGYFE